MNIIINHYKVVRNPWFAEQAQATIEAKGEIVKDPLQN